MVFLASCAREPSPVVLPDVWSYTDSFLEEAAQSLSVREAVGQLLLPGLEDPKTGAPLTELSEEDIASLAALAPGGVVLYGGSFRSLEQVTGLVTAVDDAIGLSPFVGVDYEGGLVSRLTDTGGVPATPIPQARLIGERLAAGAIGIEQVELLGELMGSELRAVGANMNFAPVADVDPPDGIGAIGRDGRTFGRDPVLVGQIAAALTRGMQRQGVAAVVKHFPGHGAVTDDSHFTLPTLPADRSLLLRRDLAAFETVFASRPAAIMTAHMSVPSLDSTGTPATLSAPILSDLLREEIGYDGLVVTDALNMRAMTEYAPEAELVVAAVLAGADIILKPVDAVAAAEALLDAVSDGRLSRERIDSSVARILRSKLELGVLSPFPQNREWQIGNDAHAALIRDLRGE